MSLHLEEIAPVFVRAIYGFRYSRWIFFQKNDYTYYQFRLVAQHTVGAVNGPTEVHIDSIDVNHNMPATQSSYISLRMMVGLELSS